MFLTISIPRKHVVSMAYALQYEIQDLYILPSPNYDLIAEKEAIYNKLGEVLTATAIRAEDCVFEFTESQVFPNLPNV
jgi:hypothetical protein